ncbi:LysR family transcriptional regulator [Bordetella genomosp. 13]|uniref:LysR family transcriptional regulator n=1 Tax=Bordetella genomosp. 13 TaxID=463040 RepID=A0A1W6ZKQ9_9BORD|nr:LysR family transcriptional regulator [Bordetella genomosp. 13]ARP97384.1 LysR family transcriptional regulator [Bordetella genomosp. 13]
MISTAMRHFLEVVRTGSIAGAAQQLHVAPSAVSRQIGKLEGLVGAPLFDRVPRGMRLSDAGRQLSAYASASALEAERVLTAIRQRSTLGEVTVRIASTEGFAQQFLSQAMARFKRLHAGVRFHMHVGHGEEVGRRVAEGLSHIGIRYSLAVDRRLETRTLCAAPVYAIMCKRHPLATRKSIDVRHLRDYPLALGDTDTTVRQLFDNCCANVGLHLEPSYVSNYSAAFLPLLPGDLIVALSGYLVVQGQPYARRLVAVPFSNPELHQRAIQALTLQSHPPPPMAAAFLDFISVDLARAARPDPQPPVRRRAAGSRGTAG